MIHSLKAGSQYTLKRVLRPEVHTKWFGRASQRARVRDARPNHFVCTSSRNAMQANYATLTQAYIVNRPLLTNTRWLPYAFGAPHRPPQNTLPYPHWLPHCYIVTSLVPGLFFATQRIDGWTHEKYGLVSTAEVIVRMREIICMSLRIKLNDNNNKLDNTTKKVIEEEGVTGYHP